VVCAPALARAVGGGKLMKSNYKIAAAVIGSFVLGVGTASILRAEVKPLGYLLLEIDVKDHNGYTKDFQPKAQATVKEFGGKVIAGGFNKTISFIGAQPPSRVVLIQFSDMDALKAFQEKENENVADVGSKYASFRVIGIEGIEQK
jgi:uncharacterized protein (DUF1330 family)